MSDYADHLTAALHALGEASWLLPDGKIKEAREKATLVEQHMRALITWCLRQEHAKELEEIARHHSNAQVLTPRVVAYFPPFSQK